MTPRRVAGLRAAVLVPTLAAALSAGTAPAGAAQPIIYTVAGDGVAGYRGNSRLATDARLNLPRGLAVTPDGGFLIAEANNAVVRRVSRLGAISTVAGTGAPGYGGDGAAAARAQLDFVHAVAAGPGRAFLIADTLNHRIRRVSSSGRILTVAGVGSRGYGGDFGPARRAALSAPHGVALTADGGFLIADTDNDRIRRVGRDGVITTVAGTGARGFSGDGGAARDAQLDRPFGIAVTAGGGFLIADAGNNRVRRVDPAGRITTVAGTGAASYGGDGGPAVNAGLAGLVNVAATSDGGFLVTDQSSNRIRRVTRGGTISTVAGGGRIQGDGGSATAARLDQPKAAVPTPDGGMLIADAGQQRIRFVAPVRAAWLAVALVRRTFKTLPGEPLRIRFVTTVAASARLELLNGTRLLRRIDVSTRPATRRTVTMAAPSRAGAYRLRLVAGTARHQMASDAATLTVSG